MGWDRNQVTLEYYNESGYLVRYSRFIPYDRIADLIELLDEIGDDSDDEANDE